MLSKRRQIEKYLFYYPTFSSRTGEISMVKKLRMKFAFLKDRAGIDWEENEIYFWSEGSILYDQIKIIQGLGKQQLHLKRLLQ